MSDEKRKAAMTPSNCQRQYRRKIYCLLVCLCFFTTNMSVTRAALSGATDLAITAAEGILREDDQKLESSVRQNLQSETEKAKLKAYVERTRPIIKDKTDFLQSMYFGILGLSQYSAFLSDMLMGTAVNAYVFYYKMAIAPDGDDETLKKFAELREHNIDADHELMDMLYDMKVGELEHLGQVVNGNRVDMQLIVAKGKLIFERYKSSSAAIESVLQTAGITMQPEDVGGVISNQFSKK